jgi:hypothetical protein
MFGQKSQSLYLATALSGIVLVYITLKLKKVYFNFPKTFILVVLFYFGDQHLPSGLIILTKLKTLPL